MSSKTLFPVFDVPEISTAPTAAEQKYSQSVLFDFDAGDFVRDGAGRLVVAGGREAYIQWCIKIVQTERLAHLAYGSYIGVEAEAALKNGDAEAVKSAFERNITEALMVNKHTQYVRDFVFTSTGTDGLYVEFTVKGKSWEEKRLGTTITT